jgi:hypothetical protein
MKSGEKNWRSGVNPNDEKGMGGGGHELPGKGMKGKRLWGLCRVTAQKMTTYHVAAGGWGGWGGGGPATRQASPQLPSSGLASSVLNFQKKVEKKIKKRKNKTSFILLTTKLVCMTAGMAQPSAWEAGRFLSFSF